MTLGDGIRRNVAKITDGQRARLRDAFIALDSDPRLCIRTGSRTGTSKKTSTARHLTLPAKIIRGSSQKHSYTHVRPAWEFAAGHIPGALPVPLGEPHEDAHHGQSGALSG
jgi:hypothetical protein